jgi:hypothetical protein
VFWLWRSELQLDQRWLWRSELQRRGLNGWVSAGEIGVFSVGQRRSWGVIDRGFGFGANLLHDCSFVFYLRLVEGVRGNSGI